MTTASATLNGTTLATADASEYEVVEGNIYFPPTSVKTEYLSKTSSSTHCPWKGDAAYYTVTVRGREVKDGAWYYPAPFEKATKIKDYVAFCELDCFV